MRMTYTQYSLQLHIHINTASNYILHVNVILFKQTRKGNCNNMLSFHSTVSLLVHQTASQEQARCSSCSSLGAYHVKALGLDAEEGGEDPLS